MFNNAQVIALTLIFHFTCIYDDVIIFIQQHILYSLSLYMLCISCSDVIIMFDYVLCLNNSLNISLSHLYLLMKYRR